jgi:hypothetical protein
MVKKLCKSFQKIVKKTIECCQTVFKNCQKVVKNCQTAGKKWAIKCDWGGEAQSYSKAFSRPQAKIANFASRR